MISQGSIVHFPFFHEDVRKLSGLFCLDFIDDLYFFFFLPRKDRNIDFFSEEFNMRDSSLERLRHQRLVWIR